MIVDIARNASFPYGRIVTCHEIETRDPDAWVEERQVWPDYVVEKECVLPNYFRYRLTAANGPKAFKQNILPSKREC